MGFYREQVVPRLVDATCGSAGFNRWRADATEGLHGRVVEVGFGSGLNVAHYPPEVEVVLAVEPAAQARRLAQRRIRAASVDVEHVGLDGQELPLEDASCDAGLSTFTEALGGMTGIQVTARLYKRIGPRRLMLAGNCGATVAIGSMALAGPDTAFWLIPLLMFLTGCSFGFAMAPAQVANMANVSAAATGQASTLVNTVRQAGGAASVALLGTVLAATGAGPANLAGYRLAFAATAGLMVMAGLCSAFVNDADAAATMAKPPLASVG